jgi:hypothetical protein
VASAATLLVVDGRTNSFVRTLPLGHPIDGLAAAGDGVWVSVG